MMGSILSRTLLMLFGYLYPAYQCFKAVEKQSGPGNEPLFFWCHYWILVALFSIAERFTDAYVSWLPMYKEVKLAYLIYLWYPKTRGTVYVYDFWVRPYIVKHEAEIDNKLFELNLKVSKIGLLLREKAENYGQTWFVEILQHFWSARIHSDQNQLEDFKPEQEKPEEVTSPSPDKNVIPDQYASDLEIKKVLPPEIKNQHSCNGRTVRK